MKNILKNSKPQNLKLKFRQRTKWVNIIRNYQMGRPYMKRGSGRFLNSRCHYNRLVSAKLVLTLAYLTKSEV